MLQSIEREKRRKPSSGPIDLSQASKPRGITAKRKKAMCSDEQFNEILRILSDYEPEP